MIDWQAWPHLRARGLQVLRKRWPFAAHETLEDALSEAVVRLLSRPLRATDTSLLAAILAQAQYVLLDGVRPQGIRHGQRQASSLVVAAQLPASTSPSPENRVMARDLLAYLPQILSPTAWARLLAISSGEAPRTYAARQGVAPVSVRVGLHQARRTLKRRLGLEGTP